MCNCVTVLLNNIICATSTSVNWQQSPYIHTVCASAAFVSVDTLSTTLAIEVRIMQQQHATTANHREQGQEWYKQSWVYTAGVNAPCCGGGHNFLFTSQQQHGGGRGWTHSCLWHFNCDAPVCHIQNSHFVSVIQLVHYPRHATLVKFAQATLCLLNSATLLTACVAYFRHELYNVMSETHAHMQKDHKHTQDNSSTHVSLHSFDHAYIN